jgi:hypothetical protein
MGIDPNDSTFNYDMDLVTCLLCADTKQRPVPAVAGSVLFLESNKHGVRTAQGN